jgi:hypothetical protein
MRLPISDDAALLLQLVLAPATKLAVAAAAVHAIAAMDWIGLDCTGARRESWNWASLLARALDWDAQCVREREPAGGHGLRGLILRCLICTPSEVGFRPNFRGSPRSGLVRCEAGRCLQELRVSFSWSNFSKFWLRSSYAFGFLETAECFLEILF